MSTSMRSAEPPLLECYDRLVRNSTGQTPEVDFAVIEECELPLIDLSRLKGGELEVKECKRQIVKAAEEWGFFQVVNHGISEEILEKMRSQQVRVFKKPFEMKEKSEGYRWGTSTATSPTQLNWSEAFQLTVTSSEDSGGHTNLSSAMQQFTTTVRDLAQRLAELLAENIGRDSTIFKENCLPHTPHVRMNRYPPCPLSRHVFGLVKHTDSNFLTILHQHHIGGLQVVKDGKWIAVKPKQETLIINIGDLFEAWSNGVYKSVQHRVIANKLVERFSTAFFFAPSNETVIESCIEPSIYRKFSFGEFREQVVKDVQKLGFKIGLPRFLAGQ